MKQTKQITTGSHFSGYGSYLFALDSLGVKYKSLFACDIDKYAKQTYQANHNTEQFFDDVTAAEVQEAPTVDLFITSPPCQSFSMAGKRGGTNDARGTLFFHSLEYIKNKRPRFFIFENVKGLLSSEGGATFKSWLEMLGKTVNGGGIQQDIFQDVTSNSAGYHLKWAVLNSKNVGWPEPVPQNRERVFIVGFRDLEDYKAFKMPKKSKLNKSLMDLLDNFVDEKYFLSNKMIDYLEAPQEKKGGYTGGAYIDGDISQTITSNYYKMPRIGQYVMTKNHAKLLRERIKTGGRAVNINNKIASCLCASDYIKNQKEANYILTKGELKAPEEVRRLTPNECRKLMGLPDTFIQPNSNSQAYKQYGNSIVVNTLAAIINNLPL